MAMNSYICSYIYSLTTYIDTTEQLDYIIMVNSEHVNHFTLLKLKLSVCTLTFYFAQLNLAQLIQKIYKDKGRQHIKSLHGKTLIS